MIYLTDILNESLFGGGPTLLNHERLIAKAIISFMKREYNFNAKITVRKVAHSGALGAVRISDASINRNKFYVSIGENHSVTEIIETLIHELIHVKQISKGELGVTNDWTGVTWKGDIYMTAKEYNKILKKVLKKGSRDYIDLPWELEAERNVKKLYNKFMKSKEWNMISGEVETYS